MEIIKKQKIEPSKRITIHGVEMTKNQAYQLWLKGLLAGPVKQENKIDSGQAGMTRVQLE